MATFYLVVPMKYVEAQEYSSLLLVAKQVNIGNSEE